ncbi:uncharacterized protein M6G45_015758 [Spheniscus humboldti]
MAPITKIPELPSYLLAPSPPPQCIPSCGTHLILPARRTGEKSRSPPEVRHHFSQMSFGGEWDAGRCFYSCDVQCPQPLATSCNDPCVVSCGTSRVIIYPPPVVVTFPGPILSTCPQETVVGSSAVLERGAPAPLTSLRAEVLCSEPPAERFVPKYVPQCAPRCSYVFSSHWMHPCNRPSYRHCQPSESKREERAPEKKPETENTDTANEDKETSEA